MQYCYKRIARIAWAEMQTSDGDAEKLLKMSVAPAEMRNVNLSSVQVHKRGRLTITARKWSTKTSSQGEFSLVQSDELSIDDNN